MFIDSFYEVSFSPYDKILAEYRIKDGANRGNNCWIIFLNPFEMLSGI